jgi:hypothetical protein
MAKLLKYLLINRKTTLNTEAMPCYSYLSISANDLVVLLLIPLISLKEESFFMLGTG